MQVRDDGCDCELPLEPDRQIDDDPDDDEEQGQRTIGRQFLANLRADEFNPAQFSLSRPRGT